MVSLRTIREAGVNIIHQHCFKKKETRRQGEGDQELPARAGKQSQDGKHQPYAITCSGRNHQLVQHPQGGRGGGFAHPDLRMQGNVIYDHQKNNKRTLTGWHRFLLGIRRRKMCTSLWTIAPSRKMSEIQLRAIVQNMDKQDAEQQTNGDEIRIKSGRTMGKFSRKALEIEIKVGKDIESKIRKVFDLNTSKTDDDCEKCRCSWPVQLCT